MSAVSERMPVQAVLLDALGTLVGLDPPAPALRKQLRARFGVAVDARAAATAMRAEIAYYRAHNQAASDRDRLAELRRACAGVVQASLGEALRGLDLDELAAALLAALRFRCLPDVVPALDALRARGLRLVVVSNWDISLHDVLAELELDARLDAVVTSAEWGAVKPDPSIFHEGLRRAGAMAAQALHVGDSLREDVQGARAAGVRPILVLHEPDAAPPPGVTAIRSLRELTGLAP